MVSVFVIALLSAGGWGGVGRQEAPPDPVCVVAHLPPGVDAGTVEVELVRRLFLVRQQFWPDGTTAHPVNLPANSPVREEFSRAAFGQGVRELAAYWNDRYFHGTRPPPTVGSPEALRLFLSRTEGSVGYLLAEDAASLPPGIERLFCLPPSS